MKTTLAKRAALIAVLVLGSSAWLSAQNDPAPESRLLVGAGRHPKLKAPELGTNSQPVTINKGSSIIGTPVKNQQGEELGKIRDLVIDFGAERVAYVVLASPTGPFRAEKLQAVPWRAFQFDATGKLLVLNADKERLARSEGLAKDNWPAVGTTVWGAEPAWRDNQETNSTPRVRESEPQIRENKDTKEPDKTEPQPQP